MRPYPLSGYGGLYEIAIGIEDNRFKRSKYKLLFLLLYDAINVFLMIFNDFTGNF